MLLSHNYIKILKGYQRTVAKEILEEMKKCEDNHLAYPMAIRIFANLSKSELIVARELINRLGDSNKVIFAHHDLAQKLFVSDTVAFETIRALNVSGVIHSKGIGNKKSVMIALDKETLHKLADIIDTFI